MKFYLMLSAAFVMTVATMPAQATENRMTVHEIHSFIGSANSAINNPNINVARNFLNRSTAENAIFENHVSVYGATSPWINAWYGSPAYGAYYRYPLNPYYTNTSMNTLGKWDQINLLENKKRMIPGYQAQIEVTGTNINPYGQTAVVDLDMKEYSLAYNPYYPSLATQVLHANSKCKAYLHKVGEEMILNRMDCNTNTSLPL